MTDLIHVNDIKLLPGDTVVETTLLIEVDDLERFELLGKLTSSNVGIDVEELTLVGPSKGSEDGQSTRGDRGFDRSLVHSGNLADKTVLVPV
jgi:hypothetical protein